MVVSCSNKDGGSESAASVTTSPASLIAGSEKSELTLEVTASGPWYASVPESCGDWMSVSPTYCADSKGTVKVSVDENIRKSERTGEVNIRVAGSSDLHPVTVKQAAYDPGETEYVCPLDGYSLVWHDEFDEGSVKTANWKFENWPWYYVNNELQYYVAGGEFDGFKTAFVEEDALHIKAQKYTGNQKFNNTTDINGKVISARMNTKSSWTYGYFEAAIWLPKGKGTWPAFWMMPNDQSDGWPTCGEIDIMEEVGVDANQTSSSIHTQAYNHTKNTQKTKSQYTSGAESGYHIYALEWTKDYLQFYTDGKKTLRFDNDGKGDKSTWPFSKAFYMTLNLAWGGDWGGYNGVDESALPCTMKVDYVRVYQKDR